MCRGRNGTLPEYDVKKRGFFSSYFGFTPGGGEAMSITVTSASGEGVLALEDTRATDALWAGAKAASLSRAASAGLPVLPGFVLTVGGTTQPEIAPAVHAAWAEVSDHGRRPLVVRSSSRSEDGETSSMAGQFASVLDVQGWNAFCDAVAEVLASSPDRSDMAVLVQPLLRPVSGGVLFGADPITGRRDRMVVATVTGGPDHLVHGEVDGTRSVMTRHGRVLEREPGDGGYDLDAHQHRALARLARTAQHLFGGPQDIEWAIDDEGALWLLQSRPITTLAPPAKGPVLGAGPIAETFPDPLAPSSRTSGWRPCARASRRRWCWRGSPPAAACAAGRPSAWWAAGPSPTSTCSASVPARPGGGRSSTPSPPPAASRPSWRVGRLRAALPTIGRDIVTDADALLGEVPALARRSPTRC